MGSAFTIDGEAYTLDAAGNSTAKTDYLAGATSNYTYDKIYELTQTMQGANTTESYSYDPVGNRLSSLGVSSYTNNSSNEMTATSNASYTYDNNGNTTSKTETTGTANYTWDFENRLTSVTLPHGGGSVLHYDPFGRRIQKASPLSESRRPQRRTTSTTATTMEETDQMARCGEVRAGKTSTSRWQSPAPGADFYEQDGLGSVTSLTNGTGTVAQSYTYDSFGNTTNSSGNVANPFRYTGRDFDSKLACITTAPDTMTQQAVDL